MACYEFMCPYEHVTVLYVKLKDRPEKITCPICEHKYHAVFVLSAVPTTFRLHDRKAFKKRGGK
jgi:hypothetical protein